MKKFKEFWTKKTPKIKKNPPNLPFEPLIAEKSVENLDKSLARFSKRVSFLNFA